MYDENKVICIIFSAFAYFACTRWLSSWSKLDIQCTNCFNAASKKMHEMSQYRLSVRQCLYPAGDVLMYRECLASHVHAQRPGYLGGLQCAGERQGGGRGTMRVVQCNAVISVRPPASNACPAVHASMRSAVCHHHGSLPPRLCVLRHQPVCSQPWLAMWMHLIRSLLQYPSAAQHFNHSTSYFIPSKFCARKIKVLHA